jgi:hypothetical protein
MILAEENVVLARANGELSEHMTKLHARQRKQTKTLESLLANSDFGLATTVLNEVLPSGQTLLELLDLPGTYSRLTGGLRGPVRNDKGVLSILALTTLATRPDLIDSIERQLKSTSQMRISMWRRPETRRFGDVAQRVSRRAYTLKGCGNDFQLRAVRPAEESPTSPEGTSSDRV